MNGIIEHSYVITFEQHVAAALRHRASNKVYRRMLWLNALAGGIVVALIMRGSGVIPISVALVLGVVAAYYATSVINKWFLKKTLRQFLGDVQKSECKIAIEPEGFSVEGEDSK